MKVGRGWGVFEKVFFVVGRLTDQRVRTLLVALGLRTLKIGVFARLKLLGSILLRIVVAVKISKRGRSISLNRKLLLVKLSKNLQ